MSITVKTNLQQVNESIRQRLAAATNPETILRPMAFDIIDLMTKRIHVDGKASDAGDIGTYSKGYLSLRQRKFNRSADPKIIVSLTRQLENDWAVIATDKGYGVGFNNAFNLQKARWVEQIKDKEIFSLSAAERDYAVQFVNDNVALNLNG